MIDLTGPHPMVPSGATRYDCSDKGGGERVAVSKLTDEQWEFVRGLEAQGVPRTEIARRLAEEHGVSITSARLSQVLGPKVGGPRPGSRSIRIMLTDAELNELRRIAADLGYVGYIGKTTGVGSMSELLRAIARGDVKTRKR